MSLNSRSQLTHVIGRAIAKYRQAKGLTQAELAEILGIGNDAVSRMERGTIVPTVTRLIELAEIFDCEAADLLTDSSNRPQDQARQLYALLLQLDYNDRLELIDIIKSLVKWHLDKNKHLA